MCSLYLIVFFSFLFIEIKILLGKEASLVCNSSLPINDDILLIRWFKNDIDGVPLYTVDGRHSENIENGEHFKSGNDSNRITMNLHSKPFTLKIKPVQKFDDGIYYCKIDFKWSRTLIDSIYLNVIGKCNQLHL